MKLIVGLGNPGQKYIYNRHNAGHLFINCLNEELRMKNYDMKAIKTDVFMNQSGGFVKKAVRNSQSDIRNLYVAHDDLDIPFGSFKIQFGRGPKVHNGIDSVVDALGTEDFWRIRIGVDARTPETPRISGEEYVLSDFTKEELQGLTALFSEVVIRLKTV